MKKDRSPEEVVLAVHVVTLGKALVCELHVTVGALEAARVPAAVEHLEDEPVQYGLTASCALRYGG